VVLALAHVLLAAKVRQLQHARDGLTTGTTHCLRKWQGVLKINSTPALLSVLTGWTGTDGTQPWRIRACCANLHPHTSMLNSNAHANYSAGAALAACHAIVLFTCSRD
jgi:hypothetical protein